MPNFLLAFITAFAITYVVTPQIIKIALAKRLYDEPEDRSSHSIPTPSLGGVGIFAGLLVASMLWMPLATFSNLKYILVAVLIIFLTGLKDDLSPMSARNKLIAQLAVAAILVYVAGIRLESMHGIFSWSDPMPYWLSLVLSIFTVLVVTNAFNLIDGINGLASSIGIVVFTTLGLWFYGIDHQAYAILAFAFSGALLAFLRFNLSKFAQIFMGDTGSLVVGTIAAVLTLEFIEMNAALPATNSMRFEAGPVIAMTIIGIPLFDTLRVFITRIIRGRSPFLPDRRHIHHLLIDFGCSHLRATSLLILFNIGIIAVAVSLQGIIDQHLLLLLVTTIMSACIYFLHKTVLLKRAQEKKIEDLMIKEREMDKAAESVHRIA